MVLSVVREGACLIFKSSYVIRNAKYFITVTRDILEEQLYEPVVKVVFLFRRRL